MAHDGDRRGADAGVLGGEAAAERGLDAQHAEEVPAHRRDPHPRRLGRAGDRHHAVVVLRHDGEAAVAIAEILEVRVGEPGVGTAVGHFPHGRQTVGRRIRQRPQQNAVDDAEDGRGSADGQGQGEHGDGCRGRVPGQDPESVAKVEHQGRHLRTTCPDSDGATRPKGCLHLLDIDMSNAPLICNVQRIDCAVKMDSRGWRGGWTGKHRKSCRGPWTS